MVNREVNAFGIETNTQMKRRVSSVNGRKQRKLGPMNQSTQNSCYKAITTY